MCDILKRKGEIKRLRSFKIIKCGKRGRKGREDQLYCCLTEETNNKKDIDVEEMNEGKLTLTMIICE